MRAALIHDPLHNPFHNRFNYPVSCRRAEMQAYAYKSWQQARNQGFHPGTESNFQTKSHGNVQIQRKSSPPSSSAVARENSGTARLEPAFLAETFASVFALIIVLLAAAAGLLKAF
jgi:hypothetical protein